MSETLEDKEWDYEEFNPDLTIADIQKAIRNGKITVYSSMPIKKGVFVSPSRMEAESYSGNGKIYEKTVDINDVAWIDPTQGQFAKVDDIRYSSKRIPPNIEPNKLRTPGKRLIESPLTKDGGINYNYEEHDPLSFDNRAKPNSKSSINWVYKAEIFSTVENKIFHQKLAEIRQGSDAFIQTEDGEYIIPIENKLVFTNGDFDTPYIQEIFEVITEHSTNFEKVKDMIVDEARGKAGHREAVQLVKQVFGDGFVLQYKSNADGAYGWADRKFKGRNRRAAINNFINQQYRKRNAGKSSTNQSIIPSLKRDPSISEEASNYILDTKEYQDVLGVLEKRFNTLGKVKLSPKAITISETLQQHTGGNYTDHPKTESSTELCR